MQVQNDVSLKDYNTFGLDVRAARFVSVDSVDALREVLQSPSFDPHNVVLLGGGSNVLFAGDPDGLVIRNEIMGIEVVSEDDEKAVIKSGAGENWHELVMWTLDHGFFGLENLSLIPGTVGAAPMQNIGAYGVEIGEVFTELEAVDLASGDIRTFNKEDCRFGYRNSIFKNELKGQYFIASVTLQLSKTPDINVEYGAIRETLRSWEIDEPSPLDVSKAVISIRESKLPDPSLIGNAGSFFKNPVIDLAHFRELKEKWTALPGYSDGDQIKVPAGWLIEQCGWKGKRVGEVGVHDKQALVLVNFGEGSGSDLLKLSEEIRTSVKEVFNIDLVAEVNVI